MAASAGTAPANPFVAVSPGQYRLEAPLTVQTVAALRTPGLAIIEGNVQGVILDLQKVLAVDSAGLALLIDWLAEARLRGCALKYSQLPATVISLARLSNVEKLIQS
jgi:phospholipid transport system transporter-binding protein